MVSQSATASAHSAVAEQLLQLLNVSVPFTLFTSFDYLGFWMYAVFGLLAAGPLFRQSLSAKIAASTLGLYGLLFHVLFAGVMMGRVGSADIVAYATVFMALLLVSVIALVVCFREAMASVLAWLRSSTTRSRKDSIVLHHASRMDRSFW